MYPHVFAGGAFVKPSLPSSALQIVLELYKAGTQSGGYISKLLLSSASGGGVGGCLGNLPVLVFIGRLTTIKIIPTERGSFILCTYP